MHGPNVDNQKAKPFNFFNFSSEIRNTIYALLFLDEEALDPCNRYYSPIDFPSGFLRTNKAIHHEARSFFYAQNPFDLTGTCEQIAKLSDQIGRENALCIRHVPIEFPGIISDEAARTVALDVESTEILAALKRTCPNLETITASRHNLKYKGDNLRTLDEAKLCMEAVRLMDGCFKEFTCLREIGIEVIEKLPSDRMRGEMRDCGWVIKAEG